MITRLQVHYGCVCINPGQLVRNQLPGSFCNITVSSINLPRTEDSQKLSNDVEKRVRVDIINI